MRPCSPAFSVATKTSVLNMLARHQCWCSRPTGLGFLVPRGSYLPRSAHALSGYHLTRREDALLKTPGSFQRPGISLRALPIAYIPIADIQSLRDGFRAIFVPGFAIITFSLPALLLGLLLRPRQDRGGGRGQLLSLSAPVPEFNQQTASLAVKLLISIVIDLIGDGSFLIPGAGEGTDLLWAPVSALLVRFLYGSNVLGAVAFLEEILPFTDVLPTATLAFIFEVLFTTAEAREEQTKQSKGQGVIDVQARRVDDEK